MNATSVSPDLEETLELFCAQEHALLPGGEVFPLALCREPERVSGLCGHLSEALCQVLVRAGFAARPFWATPDFFGYVDRPEAGIGAHCVAAVICEQELVTVDLTACQYGYEPVPLVQRFAWDDRLWDRLSRSA